MYLWGRAATPQWWAENETAVSLQANVAVIQRPNRKRLQIESASASKRTVGELQKRFGGTVRRLPVDWLKRALRQRTKPIWVADRKLTIPAGAAFGTGDHATTAMCLKMLQRVFEVGERSRSSPYRVVIDLGTGSGILALAARSLGAKRVLAIDNDPIAIRTAKENARRNKIDKVTFKTADVRRLIWPGKIDIVTANLFAELLIEVLPKLRSARWLILSGVLRAQERELRRALKENRRQIADIRRRGKWVAVLAKNCDGA